MRHNFYSRVQQIETFLAMIAVTAVSVASFLVMAIWSLN